jgi:hypothetical protein
MKQCIVKHKKAITGSAAMLLVGFITLSFQEFPYAQNQFTGQQDLSHELSCTDTLPEKEGLKMKDFDKLQVELEKAMGEVNAQVLNLDLSKIQKEAMAQALKAADMDKAMQEVSLALKNIDLDKMMADVSASLKNVNQDFKSAEIEKALAEARKEMEKAKLELKEVDKKAIQQELAKAKIEIEKSKAEIEKIDMNKIMDEARAGIEKAKDEMKLTKAMFTEMEKDGLINSKAGFTIEYKNKELYINGMKQDAKTTDKYRKYFKEDHFKIKIDKE